MKKKLKYILSIVGVSVLLSSFSCKGNSLETDTSDNNGAKKQVEILVGSKLIRTDKFTKDGTPVVPMWDAPMGTTNLRTGAGFEVLNDAEHTSVWQPSTIQEGAFNHYACLIYYKGHFYAMWGNHRHGEDGPGQRVLYSRSDTWGNWTDAEELFPAPGPVRPRNESGIHLKPDRWAIIDDVLYAITYVHGAGIYPIARAVHEDGTLGDYFLVRGLPSNAGLPEYMQDIENPNDLPDIAGKIVDWYRDNDQISWWAKSGEGIPGRGIDDAVLIESFVYRSLDNELVLMKRYWGHSGNPVHNNRIYVSFNNGKGGWGRPYPTDIPDSPTRTEAVRLEDGTILLIGSQNVPYYDQALYLDRDPITVSISKDGYTFNRVYALRTASPKGFRFAGVGGRNPGYAYSSSIIHEGSLYTLYSIGKEDMGITRVSLSSLGLDN